MSKVVKSIRLSESIVKLLDDMGEFYSNLMREPVSTSQIYSQVLRLGVDDFWNQVQEQIIQEQMAHKQKGKNEKKGERYLMEWQKLKLREQAIQISLDERLGRFFVDTYFSQEKGTEHYSIKVKLEFDKSWQKRNKIELNWILEKCKIGGMIEKKEIGQSVFQKNAKEREGILYLNMECAKPISDLWCIYYVKTLLNWDNGFLTSYGISVLDVEWVEEQRKKESTEENMLKKANVLNEKLKSLRVEEEFLEFIQNLCELESRLLGQNITLNGMLVSVIRQGALPMIQMMIRLEQCVHNEIRIGGCEREELEKWEAWFVQWHRE